MQRKNFSVDLQNIKNIIFDLGGVIINIDYNKSIQELLTYSKSGSAMEFTQKAQSELFDLYETGQSTCEQFRDSLRQLGARHILIPPRTLEFPRFRGHLIAGPSGPAGRISVHAVDPAVSVGVPPRGGPVAQNERPLDSTAGQGAGLLAAVTAQLGSSARR